MQQDATSLYNACRDFVQTAQDICNALGNSNPKFAPSAIDPGQPYQIYLEGQTIYVVGSRMLSYIESSGQARNYSAVYLTTAQNFYTYVGGTTLHDMLQQYAELPAPNEDYVSPLLTRLVECEYGADNFRDPYNQGFPPILPSP